MASDDRVRLLYDWWPIERLDHIEVWDEPDEITAQPPDIIRTPRRAYVAVCTRDTTTVLGETETVLIEVPIPNEVVTEMTDENGIVYAVVGGGPGAWQTVADHINAAAQRCAGRCLPIPGDVADA